MKLKNYWKRFWTLDRHASAGFTLVELIVVIAILAILAGVGIPVYSGYITKANKQADMTLASDIKNALMVAYYNGTLQPGASVTVYFDDDKAVTVDPSGDLGAAQAMTDAFGTGYASLDLKWDGWKDQMGVAADSTMMGYVNTSSFKPENLQTLLGHVDVVVDAATGYMTSTNFTVSEEQLAYLKAAGIELVDGKVTTDEQAKAAANATVFCVADDISATNLKDDETKQMFATSWMQMNFSQMGWDPVSTVAAKYAAVLALATYIDGQAGTNFADDLGGDHATILNNQNAVWTAMTTSTDPNVQAAGAAYYGDLSSSAPYYADAMSFIGYMQGVSSSTDSMMASNSLTNGDYFSDGNVLNYVKDYVSLSDVIPTDAANGALVFYFNGESVSCLPLDY